VLAIFFPRGRGSVTFCHADSHIGHDTDLGSYISTNVSSASRVFSRLIALDDKSDYTDHLYCLVWRNCTRNCHNVMAVTQDTIFENGPE
jgi:hypothetical protein